VKHHTASVSILRSTLSHRRSVRADHRRLERELATYRTLSERRELAAVLARHSTDAARPIERILLRQ
jgi:hypothetical protein